MTPPFIITRLLDAPRDSVWKAWTEAERLKQWFGPKGVTMPACTLDFKIGGTFHYCMRTPDGADMWGKWIFREIARPERIDLVMHFSDKDGGITRHPFMPGWPLKMASVTTFGDEGGKTRLTIGWQPYEATDEENKIFNENRASMEQGWAGTFEQLEAYLAKT